MTTADPIQELITALERASSTVVIVGTLPVTDSEAWPRVRQALSTRARIVNGFGCQIIAESDNQLFQHALRTDTAYADGRLSFEELRFRRDLLSKLAKEHPTTVSFRMSSIPLPLAAVKSNGDLWYLPLTGTFETLMRFRRVTAGDSWYEIVRAYIDRLLRPEQDGRFLYEPGDELIELFDQERVPRGIYPRDAFYNTDHYQFVVWDFVFSRDGRLLIHQRGANAKDNQLMWDKSVGGHVDYALERASSDAAVRELIEELYVKEKAEQTGHEFSLLTEDPSKVIFLGDWLQDIRGIETLQEVARLENDAKRGEEPWVYYRIPGTIEHNTPRELPDGTARRLRVLADAYIFIGNTLLTDDRINTQLKNSKYRLVAPGRLKSWIEANADDQGTPFVATPDLQFIMTGRFRNILERVSQFIQYSQIRR
jgi:8-oxo-dGTP pyrophosphatase MutT (NUDIX family)